MGNSASSLPYSIGKQVSTVNHGWAMHQGYRKSDDADVTVFVGKKPSLSKSPVDRGSPSKTQLEPALHHFVNCKKLRHPHILQVYATLDTDNPTDATGMGSSSQAATKAATETGDLIIVTEPCVPLEAWLSSYPPPELLAWGLEAIVRALHFLHASANLAHGNISPESFMVTPAGDVKLWNFSLVTQVSKATGGLSAYFIEWEGLLTPQPYRSPERLEGKWDALAASNGTHAMDSFGLGVLIANKWFGGDIPQPLIKAVQRLQTPNFKMRPRLQPLLKCPVFDTPYQKVQLQLEEFTVQPVETKIAFWQNLTATMQAGLVPENLSVYKLLPLMKQTIETICGSDTMRAQDMYRRELAAMLQPMFYIAEHYLDGDKFAKQCAKTIGVLFTVTDRGIRGALLNKVHLMAQHMDKHSLNESVFGPMCSGFSDSSAALRELTLKGTSVLVPHLTQPNLEKLSRYLVRLQADPEPSIRTNTVIFFSKLAPHLTETSRQKNLLPAFTRAMKDPFAPCRLNALKSVSLVKEFFTPTEVASTVIPAVSPHLLDGAAAVRKEAFSVLDDFLAVVRRESAKMPDSAQQQQQQQAPQSGGAPAAPPVPAPQTPAAATTSTGSSSSSGYLSGLSSWMSSTTAASPAPAPPPVATPAAAPVTPGMATMSISQPTPPMAPAVTPALNNTPIADDDDSWGDDGLDDLDNGLGMSPAPAPVAKPVSSLVMPPPSNDDDDDFFSGFDSKPAKPAVVARPKATKGKLVMPSKKRTGAAAAAAPKPAVTKLAVKDDSMNDGWDDF